MHSLRSSVAALRPLADGSAWTIARPGAWAMVANAIVLVLAWLIVDCFYYLFVYGSFRELPEASRNGLLMALCYATAHTLRRAPRLWTTGNQLDAVRQAVKSWNLAVVAALVISVLTRDASSLARAPLLVGYVACLLALVVSESFVRSFMRHGIQVGWFATQRVLLVGQAGRLRAYLDGLGQSRCADLHWIVTSELPEVQSGGDWSGTDAALAGAVAQYRSGNVGEVFLLAPSDDEPLIERFTDAFAIVPASLYLATHRSSRRPRMGDHEGPGLLPGILLERAALTASDRFAKRVFDLCGATLALILLSPLLLIVALLIKLESPGPVFFRQARDGFNYKTFRIFKFRSMCAGQSEGAAFQQTRRNDPRITRVGYWLRRLSIDELPQLLNVILGEMSLVGPRPHAIDHNLEFEAKIADYARRHNVLPGITGWAQVNGLRGATDTEEKMRARVEHDLYYIDNWSVSFDLLIVVMTVISPKIFIDAY
jgi:Undecaprenyl-phosphate glucose phosphotransferase